MRAAILSLCLFAYPAEAQTALETAGFILSGGQGKEWQGQYESEVILPDAISMRVAVRLQSSCSALRSREWTNLAKVRVVTNETINFAELGDVQTRTGEDGAVGELYGGAQLWFTTVWVNGQGADSFDSFDSKINIPLKTDPDRWKRAVAFYRDKFCKGRPF